MGSNHSRAKKGHKNYFISQMGSQAYQVIYDLLESSKNVMHCYVLPSYIEEPVHVRELKNRQLDTKMDLLQSIEDTIVAWLIDVAIQERGMHDVFALDNHFDKRLSRQGLVEQAYNYICHHTAIFDDDDTVPDLDTLIDTDDDTTTDDMTTGDTPVSQDTQLSARAAV